MRVPITDPDITNDDPEYWEKVLESHGLGDQSRGEFSVEDGYEEPVEPEEEGTNG